MTATEQKYAEPLLDLQRLVAGIRWRRRLWLPAAVLGLFAGLALAVVMPPQPSAAAKLLIVHEGDQPSDGGSLIETDIALLQTTRIAEQVLQQVGGTERPELFVKDYSGASLSNNVLQVTVEADTPRGALARAQALSEVFIADHVRRVEATTEAAVQELRDRQDEADKQLSSVNKSIANRTVDETDAAAATELSTLYARRADLSAKVEDLGARAEEAGAGTPRIIEGTEIVDQPRLVPQSVLSAGATKAAIGLGLGLVFGLALAAVSSIVQDRPVLRREITAHLGASVIAQLPPRKRLPARLWGRLRQVRERKRVAATLARTVRSEPGHVSVLELGAPRLAAALATDMATELARDGAAVVLVDDLPKRAVTKHAGDSGDGVRIVDGAGWPEPHAPTLATGYRIGVGTVRPGTPWTDLPRLGAETLLIVRAGHARTEWLHTVARQLADAGIPVIGVVLVEPDPRDRSDGTLWDALQTALRGRMPSQPPQASSRNGTRAPAPGALPASKASTAHLEVS
ncbi:MAG: Wzz/FepE/Etk N-terminal domain-containing protein [Thermocrispum sp.]